MAREITAFSTTPGTSVVQGGRAGPSMLSLMAQEEKEHRPQFRSKSMAWSEPMLLFQRMSSRKLSKTGARSLRQKEGQELRQSRPSKWARFWRKLRFDGAAGKRKAPVPAAQSDWLNYDSQSYAMNFEGAETPYAPPLQLMTKISCPGAREIVTVILQRSPSTNRNSGGILIPRAVQDVKRAEANVPLWQRRSVQAPSSLNVVKLKAPTMRRRVIATALSAPPSML